MSAAQKPQLDQEPCPIMDGLPEPIIIEMAKHACEALRDLGIGPDDAPELTITIARKGPHIAMVSGECVGYDSLFILETLVQASRDVFKARVQELSKKADDLKNAIRAPRVGLPILPVERC